VKLETVIQVEHKHYGDPGPGAYEVDWLSMEKQLRKQQTDKMRARGRAARLSRWKWRSTKNFL
jgi:hypothetical protein